MNILYPITFVAGALFALAFMALKDYFFSCPDMDEEIGEEDER
jgi:hypothetical protein